MISFIAVIPVCRLQADKQRVLSRPINSFLYQKSFSDLG
jgi:hypothetical protein